jgi:hypothetical protein
LKMRGTALEATVGSVKEGLVGGGSGSVSNVSKSAQIEKFYGDLSTGEGVDKFFDKYLSSGKSNFQQMSLDLAQATYSIRTAETAAKGYLMVVGQLGLSADQKAMVRDLEQINMAVMKVMATIKMLQLALASTNPYMMAFYLFSAGGTAAASLAYGNKVSGGGV